MDVDLDLGEDFPNLVNVTLCFLTFNRLVNGGWGVEAQVEGLRISLGAIESSIGSSSSELSTPLEESASIVVGLTSTHGGDKKEDAVEGSSFSCCSPTWYQLSSPILMI